MAPTLWREFLLTDQDSIRRAAHDLAMHPLALEDCLKSNQRAKFDDYENHQLLVWFVCLEDEIVELEFVRFDAALLVVASRPTPDNRPWKDFLGITENGADTNHLLFHALDAATDLTETNTKQLFGALATVESALFHEKTDPIRLLDLKHNLARMELATSSLASVANQWLRFLNPKDDLRWRMRDVIDHCERVHQGLVFHEAQIASSMDMYWGMTAKRTNDQIKKLSLIASIAIPLNVWAAFWGMNFQILPFDKSWLFGLAISLMIGSVATVAWFLKSKGYLDE
jgi:magnesium transporter